MGYNIPHQPARPTRPARLMRHHRPVRNINPPLTANAQTASNTKVLRWPSEHIKAAYVISIRTNRHRAFESRLQKWSSHFKLFPGTNGKVINMRSEKWKSKIATRRMKRGQIGCYDSHLRLWRKVAKDDAGPTLIAEDDVALRYTQHFEHRFEEFFQVLEAKKLPWDIIYLGHRRLGKNHLQIGNRFAPKAEVRPAHSWDECCLYLIKPSAAAMLAKHALPIREPCDVYIKRFIKNRKLKVYYAQPRFCYVVPNRSDTRGIK